MAFDLTPLTTYLQRLHTGEDERRQLVVNILAQSIGVRKSVCEQICDANPDVYEDSDKLFKLVRAVNTARAERRKIKASDL